jgi:hypothetical protein
LYSFRNKCRWKAWGGWRERKNRGCHEINTKIVTICSSPPLRGTPKRVSTGEKGYLRKDLRQVRNNHTYVSI